MKGLKVFVYLFQSTMRSLRSEFRSHLVTVLTVAIGYFMIGGQLLFFYNFQKNFLQSKKQSSISVYLKEGTFDSVGKKIQKDFCHKKFITNCELRTSQEAKRIFQKNNNELKDLLLSLEANPFPPSVEIELDENYEDLREVQSFLIKIKKFEGIDFVDDGKEWVLRWMSFLKLFRLGTWILALLFGLATVFVISNAISLLVYTQKDEVEILSIVGATDRFIRTPYLLQGAFHGVFGAGLSLVLLYTLVWVFNTQVLVNYQSLLVGKVWFLPLEVQGVFLLIGLLVGLVGSYFSVNRFLV